MISKEKDPASVLQEINIPASLCSQNSENEKVFQQELFSKSTIKWNKVKDESLGFRDNSSSKCYRKSHYCIVQYQNF